MTFEQVILIHGRKLFSQMYRPFCFQQLNENFTSCVKAKIFNQQIAKNTELINLKIDLTYTTELIYSFMAKIFLLVKKVVTYFRFDMFFQKPQIFGLKQGSLSSIFCQFSVPRSKKP